MRARWLALVAVLTASGCATLLRGHENGDYKEAVNVYSTHPPEQVQIVMNGKPVKPKLIYDGRKHDSPYFVYRCDPPGDPDKVEIRVITPAGERVAATQRRFEGWGWFWIGGLFVFVDYALGSLHYYPDVGVD